MEELQVHTALLTDPQGDLSVTLPVPAGMFWGHFSLAFKAYLSVSLPF